MIQGVESLSSLHSLAPFVQLHHRLALGYHQAFGKLATSLAAALLMPPGDVAALATVKAGAFWQRLDELGLIDDLHSHRQSVRHIGTALSLVTSMHPEQLRQVMTGNGSVTSEPVLVGEWREDGVSESEVQPCWQQLWQMLNLLLPLRQLWVGSAEMPGLPALQNCAALKVNSGTLTEVWQEALELAAQEVQAWGLALAALGASAPQPGYELMNDKGRVTAEAELAWPDALAAVLMPGTATDSALFVEQGWHVFTADGGELPAALSTLLMETQA
ncbi:hypothetical protein GXB82_22350 [Pseudomonas stutzeri]|nr:hypothetical protein [Stutzerimonas stutzeri]